MFTHLPTNISVANAYCVCMYSCTNILVVTCYDLSLFFIRGRQTIYDVLQNMFIIHK